MLSFNIHLQQVIQKTASQDILDLNFSSVQWIKEEEEFAYSSAHIEWVKGLLQPVKLKQCNGLVQYIWHQ